MPSGNTPEEHRNFILFDEDGKMKSDAKWCQRTPGSSCEKKMVKKLMMTENDFATSQAVGLVDASPLKLNKKNWLNKKSSIKKAAQ